MWPQVERIISEATNRIIEGVAQFVPGLLALVALFVASIVVATIVRIIVVRALTGLDFDRRAPQWGLGMLAEWSPARSASAFIGRAAQWTILVFGLLVALTALDAAVPSRFALSVFEYAPSAIAALIILAVGSVLAHFFARAVLIGAVNMQLQSARPLSLFVKWLILIVAASMAVEQLRVGRQILLLAFGLVFGGVVLATALAIGLGARDAVARAIDRQLKSAGQPREPIDHV